MALMKQDTYTPAELGTLLAIATRTVIDRINSKRIIAARKGRHWFISAAEVEKLLPTAVAAVVVAPIETAGAGSVETATIAAAVVVVKTVPTAADLKSMYRRMRVLKPTLTRESFETFLHDWDKLVWIVEKYENETPEQTALFHRMRRIDKALTSSRFYTLLDLPWHDCEVLNNMCQRREDRNAIRAQREAMAAAEEHARLEEALFSNTLDYVERGLDGSVVTKTDEPNVA